MLHDTKPPLDEALLVHYGVKGMRWGVINEDEPKGRAPTAARNEITKEYLSSVLNRKPVSKAEAKKRIAESQQKSVDKLRSDGASDKGLTPEQKARLKKAAIGAGVLAGVLATAYIVNKQNPKLAQDTLAIFRERAGKKVTAEEYTEGLHHSLSKAWGDGYIQPSSFSRPAFSLPAGHTFHRLSDNPESFFKPGTYSVHSKEDLNRYLHHFTEEWGGNTIISFKAKKEIKVPDLMTTLETWRETLLSEGIPAATATREYALETYQKASGSSWDNDRAKSFFANLSAKGYGAIVDEMDAGVIGETPLVLFSRDVSEKTAQAITPEIVAAARDSLIELTNRKL